MVGRWPTIRQFLHISEDRLIIKPSYMYIHLSYVPSGVIGQLGNLQICYRLNPCITSSSWGQTVQSVHSMQILRISVAQQYLVLLVWWNREIEQTPFQTKLIEPTFASTRASTLMYICPNPKSFLFRAQAKSCYILNGWSKRTCWCIVNKESL